MKRVTNELVVERRDRTRIDSSLKSNVNVTIFPFSRNLGGNNEDIVAKLSYAS